MALVALITDTHFGARDDNAYIRENQVKFFEDIFFPTIDQLGIRDVIHLGDLMDRRKYINYASLDTCNKTLIKPLHDRQLNVTFLAGNHDCYFKNRNDTNALQVLYAHSQYANNFKMLWDTTAEVVIGSCPILLCPWISPENEGEIFKSIAASAAPVMMGHFHIRGFEMHRGAVIDSGFERTLFDRFDQVFSGHYHHKSSDGHITYLGAPYEMTWSDYDDARGFHIFNTETRDLEYVENPRKIFVKIEYDDHKNSKLEDVVDFDFSAIPKGAYIKVLVKKRVNLLLFDLFLDKLLEHVAPSSLQTVDNSAILNLESNNELIDEAEDTQTIIKKYIKSIDTSVDKKKLTEFVLQLYNQAISIEE